MPETHPVADAVLARRSVRAFRPTPVPQQVLEELLGLAARSASNSDTQPWGVHVVTGPARERLVTEVLAAFDAGDAGAPEDPPYQPASDAWPEPLQERRGAFGRALFGDTLGIARDDAEGRRAAHRRNFAFYGAPVGLVLSTDRGALASGLVDAGSFLTTLMLLATERGLGTCAQVAFTEWAAILRAHLDIPEHHRVVCGVALGYADREHPTDAFRSDRVPLGELVAFHDA